MEEKPIVPSPEIKGWAYATPLLGLSSLLPYIVLWILPSIAERSTFSLIPFIVQLELSIGFYCLAWGLIIGMTGVIGGVVEIKKINNSSQKEIELRMAILSIVLGIIGIVVNILYIYFVMSVMQFD